MDVIPSTSNSLWDTRRTGLGDNPDAAFVSSIHCRVYHGRFELRGHCPAGSDTRYDDDASSTNNLGNIHGHSSGAAGFPSIIGSNSDDAV